MEYHFVHSTPDKQNERNEGKYAEYAFFWEIFGGKSNAAARLGHLVLTSPPP